jgi:hypothetical protein
VPYDYLQQTGMPPNAKFEGTVISQINLNENKLIISKIKSNKRTFVLYKL